MTAPTLLDQNDIIRRVGARKFLEWTDDSRTGTPDSVIVADGIAVASSEARTLLGMTWQSDAQVLALAADPGIKDAVVDIAIGWYGTRKPEWLGADGRNAYSTYWDRGRARLKEVAKGQGRPSTENQAGANTTVLSSVNRPLPPTMVFAKTRGRPEGPGGF